MYRRVIIVALTVLVALCFNAGCNQKELASLKEQNASKDSTILSMSTEAANQREVLFQKTTENAFLSHERDSVVEVSQMIRAENARLQNALARGKAQAAKEAQDFAAASAILKERQELCEITRDSLANELATLQGVNKERGKLIGEYVSYVSRLQPHLEWLQNEAGRNWWEKLWDRDKLPKPPYPLPQPPVITATY